ncbi:MAG: N-methyl-L-tryptophan oxidase [Lacunisphaera sp.]|nr:N-methyl-L-tryptophan oxidase [Lacunisphaera sp.]
MKYHTIVLGLGAMGSAAVYQAAKRGLRVLGLDRHSPPHPHGSSHGDTRITRQAIGEGEQYTPLSLRSFDLWREIERETGRQLLTVTGGLIISSPGKAGCNNVADFFGNTLRAAKKYNIAHEILTAAQIRQRFPQFNVRENETGYLEKNAGFLRPEACVAAQLELARRYGAELQTGEQALAFQQQGDKVKVRTDRGEYETEKLIITAGPWLPALLDKQLAGLFRVTRQVLFWFEPEGPGESFQPGPMPIFIWEPQDSAQALYGFPALDGAGGGVKVASGQYQSCTTPDTISRVVSQEEITWMFDHLVAPCLPGLSNRCVKTVTCMYTVTPDFGFVIDRLPHQPGVILASPCSGHGFKHSAAVGEALAEIAADGASRIDLSAFKLNRFAAGWKD